MLNCLNMNAEETLAFIEDYRSYPCLWDINDCKYTNKTKRNEAYSELGTKYGMTSKAVKNKIKSLRSYFSKEHQKMLLEQESGTGMDDKYETTWFAYHALLFIASPRQSRDSLAPGFSLTMEFPNHNDCEIEETFQTVEQAEHHGKIGLNSVGEDRRQSDQNVRPTILPKQPSSSSNQSVPTVRSVKRTREEDKRAKEEAVKFLKVTSHKTTNRDEHNIFSEMVACQLRKLNRRNQAIARNQIQNLLFKLELEELDNPNDTLRFEIQNSSPCSHHLDSSSISKSSIVDQY